MKNYPSNDIIEDYRDDLEAHYLEKSMKDIDHFMQVMREYDEPYKLLYRVMIGDIKNIVKLQIFIREIICMFYRNSINVEIENFINSYDENLKAARDEMNNPEKYRS